MNKRNFNHWRWWLLTITLLLVIIVSGWLVTEFLGDKAQQEIVKEGEVSILSISIYIGSELQRIEGAVHSMSGSPVMAPALLTGQDRDIEVANASLDRYNVALHASVSYLMDASGTTVASSNRHEPDSFVGKSYHFRPYFQDAIKGKPGRYYARGITSEKKGFYASFPVRDSGGNIIGAAVMKKDLDEIETFLNRFSFCVFINPDGIIYLSSKPEMAFKSLWPIEAKVQEALITSQQFGSQYVDSIFPKEVIDGKNITFEGNRYLVFRKRVDRDGWSIVLLIPTDRVQIYQLIGVITTTSVCLLVGILLGVIYITDKSRHTIQQSEDRFRELFNSMKSGVAIYDAVDNGNDFVIKDFNRGAENIDSVSRESIIGKSVLEIFPAIKEFGLFGVLQNVWKNGIPQHHPVSQYKDNRIEGWRENYVYKIPSGEVVAIYDDVTERKKMEEEIQTLSITDTLTGLYNRRGFMFLAEQQLKTAARSNKHLTLFFIDLDGLKMINDTWGHEEGDRALMNTATILKHTFRESDIIARLGGDEFAILVIDAPDSPEIILNRLKDRISHHNVAPDKRYDLSISIGAADYDTSILSPLEELISRADNLMYEQKKAKSNRRP